VHIASKVVKNNITMITWADFEKTDIRVDTIIAADDFAAAKKRLLVLPVSNRSINL
jgi:tRNA-binding EMAP/Myf-like protein